MKFIIQLIAMVASIGLLHAQKPVITEDSYKEWPGIGTIGSLSSDGKYAAYVVENLPYGKKTTVVCSTDKKWEKKVLQLDHPEFGTDNRTLYGILNKNLIKLTLSSDKIDTIAPCSNYELYKTESDEYLGYKLNASRKYILTNLHSGKNFVFENVIEAQFRLSTKSLLLKHINSDDTEYLTLVQINTGVKKNFFTGENIGNLIFNKSEDAIAFTTKNAHEKLTLWYYDFNATVPKELTNDGRLKNGLRLSLDEFWRFSSRGDKLFFTQQEIIKQTNPDVGEVWSYQDKMIYPQFKQTNNIRNYIPGRNLSWVDIKTSEVIQALQGSESIRPEISIDESDFLVIQSVSKVDNSVIISKPTRKNYYVRNVHTQQIDTLLLNSEEELVAFSLSPDHSTLIYFNPNTDQWTAYDLKKKKFTNFASEIGNDLKIYNSTSRLKGGIREAIAWVEGTNNVLLQGDSNIWEVSVDNHSKPKNLTGDIDSTTKQVFSFCQRPENKIVKPSKDIFLYSLARETKMSSLYRLNLSNQKLEALYSTNVLWGQPYATMPRQFFIKAANADAFMFIEGNVSRSMNYKFTNNFKAFVELSNNHPENNYNWISSELATYNDADGNSCKGILYKPENFDSSKKYPVLFIIYQEQSNQLNKHLTPQPVGTLINIPLMVSNGYIVFKPDVYNVKGKVGEYALKSVLAAVDYLTQFSWVERSSLGIAGHSFGGFEVNYIVTHSNHFAAALAGAGASSQISQANELFGVNNMEMSTYVAFDAPWLGTMLEDDFETYLDNSPILDAKRIQTPLLLLHNQGDQNVSFNQSLQMFVQLRRLQKKVWLINYPNEGHGIGKKASQIDYQQKVKTFFDHYLKKEPIPNWMEKHIDF